MKRCSLRLIRIGGLFVLWLLIAGGCGVKGQRAQPLSNTAGQYPAPTELIRALPTAVPTTVAGPTSTPELQPADEPTPLPTAEPTATPSPAVRFAVIGDYGLAGPAEQRVAELVKSWSPDLIITTGDNNYPAGAAETIDQNIGQYYHAFIAPYVGSYGEGADTNRFFPSLGNHDWQTAAAQPYLDYFSLPGNERYYDFTWGPVHFFALDSMFGEPDGVSSTSRQGQWLQRGLTASTACWQIVYMHHPPFSSGSHGSSDWMQWPYAAWGADTVLAGHDHTYERIERDGIVYFVNGLGGGARYPFKHIVDGSQVRFNADVGAMLVEANDNEIHFQFISSGGETVDSYHLSGSCGR